MTSPKQRYQMLILTTQAFISVGRSSCVKILKAIKYAESMDGWMDGFTCGYKLKLLHQGHDGDRVRGLLMD